MHDSPIVVKVAKIDVSWSKPWRQSKSNEHKHKGSHNHFDPFEGIRGNNGTREVNAEDEV